MGWIKIPRGRDAAALARAILSALRYRVHRRKTMAAATLLTGGYNRMPDLLLSRFPLGEAAIQGGFPSRRKSRAIRSETSGLRVCRCYRARPLARRTQTHFSAASGAAQPRQGADRRNNTSRAHYRVDAAYIRAMGSGGQTGEAPRNVLTTEIYGALTGMSREERLRKSAEAGHPPEADDGAG